MVQDCAILGGASEPVLLQPVAKRLAVVGWFGRGSKDGEEKHGQQYTYRENE